MKILKTKRHKIKLVNEEIIDYCAKQSVINKIVQQKHTLIICNTIKSAQTVFINLKPIIIKKYGEGSITLAHSKFRIKDRRKKEEKIMAISNKNNPLKVVVATQIVEVSLDIDLAYGIFEAAPLDALTQRFGRVNRKGKRKVEEHNIIITKQNHTSNIIYNKELTNQTLKILKKVENKKISESELVEMIDCLYKKKPWNVRQKEDFERAFNHNRLQQFVENLLPGTYKSWIDLVIENKDTVDLILEEDIRLYKKLKKNDPLKAYELIISTRLKSRKKIRKEKGVKLPILKSNEYTYSNEFGLSLK